MSRQDNNTNPCHLVAAYEMGLLEDDERIVFENHLPDCPDCLDEMYAMAPATESLCQDPGHFAGTMNPAREKGLLSSLLARFFSPAGLRMAAPAAVVAVLALVFLWPAGEQGPDWTGLAVLEPAAYTRIDLRGGALDEADAIFQEGMSAYQAGDYATAAGTLDRATRLLEDLPEADRPAAHLTDQILLYQGVSHLLAGHIDLAAGALEKAATSSLPPVSQRARWHLAQALLAGDQPQAAIDQLDILADSPVYGAQARAQADEIITLLLD
jgi:tetratricopeptide (TPR) repeat protein